MSTRRGRDTERHHHAAEHAAEHAAQGAMSSEVPDDGRPILEVEDLSLRQPTLDEVFLTLTGQPMSDDQYQPEEMHR